MTHGLSGTFLRNLKPDYICFSLGIRGVVGTLPADHRHSQSALGRAESPGTSDWLRYDIHIRLLHSVHVPESDLLRVSYHEQPGAPAAGRSGANGDRVLCHGVHPLSDLQRGQQRLARCKSLKSTPRTDGFQSSYLLFSIFGPLRSALAVNSLPFHQTSQMVLWG